MNYQQETRRAATQAFFEALEQLQQTLEAAEPNSAAAAAHLHAGSQGACPPQEVTLNAWEEAIADIDQFMQSTTPPEAIRLTPADV